MAYLWVFVTTSSVLSLHIQTLMFIKCSIIQVATGLFGGSVLAFEVPLYSLVWGALSGFSYLNLSLLQHSFFVFLRL